MPYYRYTAMNQAGDLLKAEGEFATVVDLFDKLQKDGLDLIHYRKKIFNLDISGSRMTRLQLAEFLRNLALLLKGGVPLRDALQDLISSPGQPAIRRVFGRIIKQLEEGILFSEALKVEKRYIPKVLVPLVAIGEETGEMDKTLLDAARHLEKIHNIISSTRRALTYPAFVLFAMLGALTFWMVYVLPQLLGLFTSMGMKDLPLATRVLIASVKIFNSWWPVIPGLFLLLFLVFLASRKNNKIRYSWDSFWSYFPLIGIIFRSSQLAFFFEYSSLLTAGGINIIRTLELMEESVKHQVLKQGIHNMKNEITAGDSMSESIAKLKFFEPFVLRMVKVGEQTGNMSEQFLILADYYMKKVNNLVEMMSKTLEPLIISIAGLVFLVIILGLLGPIYDLIATIK